MESPACSTLVPAEDVVHGGARPLPVAATSPITPPQPLEAVTEVVAEGFPHAYRGHAFLPEPVHGRPGNGEEAGQLRPFDEFGGRRSDGGLTR